MVDQNNKVFQQIQPASTDSPFGKGLILFANSYTGSPIEMHPSVREVLTSEDLFIGNNPLIQLRKAFERLKDGPWYIDCRGNVLYIHNRPYSIPAIHNYTYAKGNGEVLSISFKTQYRTKNAPRSQAMSFDGFTKNLNVSGNGISIGSEQEIADEAARIEADERQGSINQGYGFDYLNPEVSEGEANYFRSMGYNNNPEAIQKKVDIQYSELAEQDYQQSVNDLNDGGAFTNKAETFLAAKGMGKGTSSRAYLDKRIGELKDSPEKLQTFLRENFGSDTVTFYTGLYRPFADSQDFKELFPGTVYVPAYDKTSKKKAGFSYVIDNGVVGASIAKRGDFTYSLEKYVKEKGYHLVAAPQIGNEAYGSISGIKLYKVHKAQGEINLGGDRLIYDYVSRSLNSPQAAYQKYLLNHILSNTTRKITEARLEIEMRVVGRPSLTSSTKIHIDNVGFRSGDYIIKTCIHRISNDGYTCSLTLCPGNYKPASNSDTVSISLGANKKPVDTDDKNKNVSPSYEAPRNDPHFDVIPTSQELEYFNSFDLNYDKQKDIAVEITWQRYQAWKKGTFDRDSNSGVYHKHVKMNSKGEVTSVTWSFTPAPHVDNYEQFKRIYSQKYYQLIRKKAADYKRYKQDAR